jgi:hypothetical protein
MCRLVDGCDCETCVDCRDATREMLAHRLHMALRRLEPGPVQCACGRMKIFPGQGQDSRDYEGWIHRATHCDRPDGAP